MNGYYINCTYQLLYKCIKFIKIISFSFGGGNALPINLHEIHCRGNESRLIDCEYEVYSEFYCHSSQNVAITCDGEFS